MLGVIAGLYGTQIRQGFYVWPFWVGQSDGDYAHAPFLQKILFHLLAPYFECMDYVMTKKFPRLESWS